MQDGFVSLFLRATKGSVREEVEGNGWRGAEGAPTTYYQRSNVIPAPQLRVDLKSQPMRLA